jgi:hypothetical protein
VLELTTLRSLCAQGGCDALLRDLVASVGAQAADAPTVLLGRFSTTLYGFINFTMIGDSTRSFAEVAANNPIQAGGFRAGAGNLTLSVRFTRFGIRVRGPDGGKVVASALLEMDFLGGQSPTASEAVTFTSPLPRLFNAAVKLETPFVDVLAGQWWSLFGWQPFFFPSYGELTGLPAQAFGRAPQLRLSHLFRAPLVNLEVAVALGRAPERASFAPDGQAGVKVQLNRWRGRHTAAATGTATDPLTLGVSAVVRRFALPSQTDASLELSQVGWGISLDALLPVIPASDGRRANFLTLTGSFVYGSGIADLFTTTPGGAPGFQSKLPLDPGLVAFDANGALQTIQWQSFLVGAQYYLPPSASFWLSANYGEMSTGNYASFAPIAGQVITRSRFVDGNLFWDATSSLRLGLEYAWFQQLRDDGLVMQNHRGQLSAYYLF